MKQRKIPLRSCTGCLAQKPKKELLRIVRSPSGEISIDRDGKKSGRGAYICPDPECLKKARKSKRLEKSLEAAIPDSVYSQLESELEKAGGADG